jgi:8-oxo-dGTP diphosphatase
MPATDKIEGYRNPFPTTDIIIEYRDGIKEGIVLITRKNPPYGIAIPGGFAEWGICLEDNARKEAMEETGLEIILENPGRPYVYSNPDRDPRGHMISNTFYAKGLWVAEGHGSLRAGDDAKTVALYSIDEVIELVRNNGLAFDHGRILRDYLLNRGYKV